MFKSISILSRPQLFVSSKRSLSTLAGINPSALVVEKTPSPRPKFADKNALVFGKEFTDHMLEIEWDQKVGWKAPKISQYHNLSLSPASSSLHYALQCFEGMKAYIDDAGKVRLFRPLENAQRLNNSATRLRLPNFDEKAFLKCLNEFVKVDKEWIPKGKGYSLYLRPTLISTQNTLGVGPASSALLFVIASPVGPYYPSGFKPVRLLADEVNVRAWPGGTGSFKLGANYAGGIQPQTEAAAKGFSQILWLLGDQVTEVGTMNMFVLWKNKNGKQELITPPLDGTILPGITRDSILSLCRKWGEFEVSEKKFTITDMMEASKEGRLLEAFGAGTAAIVSPIESITYKGSEIKVPVKPELGSGPLAKRILDTILSIQYGEGSNEWSVVVE